MSNIKKIAEKLKDAGFVSGGRIAVLSENSPEYVSFVMACWKIGIIVIPISTRYPVSMINTALANVNCEKIFISKDIIDSDLKAKIYLIDEFVKSDISEIIPPDLDSMDLDLNADASIIFTSASSGSPKAVLHTFANHYYSALGACNNIPFGKGHRWLMSLPMYHISGFSLIMRSLLNRGTIVFPSRGESLKESILNRSFSHISLVPAQLSELLNDPEYANELKKLKAILVGGSSIPTVLIETALAMQLPVYTTYGATEMASQITTTKPGDLKNNNKTCGRILDHRQLKIASDSEILVKGETLFSGYVSGDSLELALDEDGYFHTNDIGCIDDGNLFVTGRKDMMFISGGENIFPEEIERAIESVENIDQAIVVPVPNRLLGQRPVAFVKTHQVLPLDADLIESKLKRDLEGFKVPIAFFPWPELTDQSIKPNRKAFADHASRLMDQSTKGG